MKIRLIIEKDPETGRYSSVFPELPGCASAGDTEDEAIANAQEALELWFEPSEISQSVNHKPGTGNGIKNLIECHISP